jgi:hypothetical protein
MDLNLFFEATVSTDEDAGVRYPDVKPCRSIAAKCIHVYKGSRLG